MPEESYTIADPQTTAESSPTTRATLIVYSELPSDPASRLLELADGATVTFGRSRSATVHIDSERVSRIHARVTRHGAHVMVEDLDSRNGTRIDGVKLSQPTALSPGDELSIGPIQAVLSMATRALRTTRVGTTWHLDERLAAEANRGQLYQRTFVLMMLRLEGDSEAADIALASLSRALRPMDTIAEYGPDEFAILLPETNRAQGIERTRELVHSALEANTGAANTGAVQVRAGMAAFPEHGTDAGELISRARDALRTARVQARDDVVVLPAEAREPSSAVVADPQMHKLYTMARRVAATAMTVLVCGETGAGKEVIAEAVHQASPRKDGPFVCVNCACIADTLLESELFGHERGAFTGADKRRIGYFEAASGGTLFLDEIGEIVPTLQAKLLRVLEQHTITRVGGTKEIPVDVRVVCATNRDLQAEVFAGRFRSDLFFRVTGFVLMVPPLRDRQGEIPLMARHFLEHAARGLGAPIPTISSATMAVLRAYHWPGNVRELRNAMERALVLQVGDVIEPEHLPERVLDAAQRAASYSGVLERVASVGDSRADLGHEPGQVLGQTPVYSTSPAPTNVREHMADVERASILAALETSGGNQTRAAQRLGISRRSLIYRMEKHGLKPLPASRR